MMNFSWMRMGLLGLALSSPAALLADDAKPPEAKSPEQLFGELDKNKDGKITADEIGPDHRRHFDHLLRVAGKTEKDGLTKEEFLKGVQPEERTIRGVPGFGGGGGRRGEGGGLEPGQMFERWDRNKDGKLSRDEIPEQLRERLNPVFDQLKKDEVTREEFMKARERFAGAGQFNPEEFFKRIDRNGDGKVSLDEVPDRMRERFAQALKQAGKKEGESLSREEFQKFVGRGPRDGMRDGGGQIGNPEEFVKRFDKNGDGKITLDEVDGRMRNQFEKMQERLKKDPDEGLTLADLRKLRETEMARGGGDRPGARGEGKPQRPEGDEGRRPDGERGRQPGFPPQSPLLKLLDANHDGKITKDEIARIAEMFDKLDANHDGALDPVELMGPPPERRRFDRGEGMERPESGERKPPRDGEARRPEDSKNDGAPRGDGDGGKRGGVRRRLDRQDGDQDGKISKTEARGPLLKNFDKFDSNHDGFLDPQEIRKGMRELRLEGGGDLPGDGKKKPPESEKKPVPEAESK